MAARPLSDDDQKRKFPHRMAIRKWRIAPIISCGLRQASPSTVKLLIFGNVCSGRHVERCAFFHHQAAFEREVILLSVAD
jgi:hypothetical protein